MSEPTPPRVPAPPPPELHGDKAEQTPPPEVKRAKTLYTATAAFLVFIGVSGLIMIGDAERALRKEINRMDNQQLQEQIGPGMIRGALSLLGVALLALAIGHGLTAQGLRDRKSWARPVGFTFSGILLALAVLSTIAGAVTMQSLFFLVAGLTGILGLAKPAVRDYLAPWPKQAPGPHGNWPQPGSGPPGGPPSTPPYGPPPPAHQDDRPGDDGSSHR